MFKLRIFAALYFLLGIALAICAMWQGASAAVQSGSVARTPGVVLDPSTENFISRISIAGYALPNYQQTISYDTLIKALKVVYPGQTGSAWQRLDVLYDWATYDQNVSLLNVRQNAYNGTVSGTATWTFGKGWAGNGTNGYINSGFNPNTATSPNYVLNSAHVCVWPLTVGAFQYVAGTASGSNQALRMGLQSGNAQDTARFNNITSAAGPVYTSAITPADLTCHSRQNSTNIEFEYGGHRYYTSAAASTAVPTGNITFLADPSSTNYATDQLAFATIGAYLTDFDQVVIRSAMKQFMLAMGQVTTTAIAISPSASNLVRAVEYSPTTSTSGQCAPQAALGNYNIVKDGPVWTFQNIGPDNWSGNNYPYTVTGASWSGGVATFTVSGTLPTYFNVGTVINTTLFNPSGYNVTNALITAITTNTISIALASNPGPYTSGSALTWTDRERSEMSCPAIPAVGTLMWTAYSIYLDPITTSLTPFKGQDSTQSSGWSVFGQWHEGNNISSGSPSYSMTLTHANNGTSGPFIEGLSVAHTYDTNGTDTGGVNSVNTVDYQVGANSIPFDRGHWHSVVIEFQENQANAGILAEWIDGHQIVNLTGINIGYAADSTGSYLKFGMYGGPLSYVSPAPISNFKVKYANPESCASPCSLLSRVTNPLPVLP